MHSKCFRDHARHIIVSSTILYFAYAISVWLFGVTKFTLGIVLISLLFGNIAAGIAYAFSGAQSPKVSSIVTGLSERLFFCVAVGNSVGGAGVAMIAWTALKNTSYWKAIFNDESSESTIQNGYVVSSLVSLFFAMLGGLVIRDESAFELAQPVGHFVLGYLFGGNPQ